MAAPDQERETLFADLPNGGHITMTLFHGDRVAILSLFAVHWEGDSGRKVPGIKEHSYEDRDAAIAAAIKLAEDTRVSP